MTRKAVLLTVVLFPALSLWLQPAAHAQTIKVRALPVTFRSSPLSAYLQFFCSAQYKNASCVQNTKALASELASYPYTDLRAWSFLIVPSEEWQETVRGLHHDPASPAFSVLDERITVLENSLFQPKPERAKELLVTYGVLGRPLLQLALAHEMSHALCMDRDERRADENGDRMRRGVPVVCRPVPSRAANSNSSANPASGK